MALETGDRSAEERLKEIMAVTDASLGHLDLDSMLAELLDRVRMILHADTAAVLLLEEGSGELVARAARGIEEEVRQGVRIPLGEGFAGRVAAEKRPVSLERVDASTVSNPILWEKGIRTMLGVPLMAGGNLLGVLHVGTLGSRVFTNDDAYLLELVAERVSGATQAHQLELERAAGKLLQRSLLPTALHGCPGLAFATRYVPAEDGGVGGDWYDAFILPNGEFWIVTGDVAGHGLRPAIVMSRLRSTIRSYALTGASPADVLALADRELDHFEPGEMATVVVGASTPPFDRFYVSSAGHLPPVLAARDAATELVRLDVDPPLGSGSSATRQTTDVMFSPGGVMVLYTDGLIERRDAPLDAGLTRLCAAVEPAAPAVVCHKVMDSLVGKGVPRDDIALMVIQRAN